MAKVTFKLKTFNPANYKNPIDAATALKIGQVTIDGIKEFTSKGLSPVKGKGRFDAYKAQAITDKSKKKSTSQTKKGYPYNVQSKYPDKKVRPVNLRLSGKMLAALKSKFQFARQIIEVGIYEQKEALKAETHNLGTQSGRVPVRQFLPRNDQNQSFAESIRKQIVDIATKRILDIIRRNK